MPGPNLPPLAYEGTVATPYIVKNFPPQASFITFQVPTIWVDTNTESAYVLVGVTLGTATWLPLGSGTGNVAQIDTPDGAHVTPTAGVINFLNGTAMSITGSGDSITFNSLGGGLQWIDVTSTSQTLSPGIAYSANNASQVAFSLPATATFGDFYVISGFGSGGWTINQNAGQSIIVGNLTSSVGVGGSVSSTTQNDSIQIVCVANNTTFKALEWAGNLTVV